MTKETESITESPDCQMNLSLWRSVEKTPPDMTKYVKARGGFTTIDAQWQLRKATSMWGPYGERWGMRNITHQIIEMKRKDPGGESVTYSIIVKADFFYPHPEHGSSVVFEIINDDEFIPGDDTLKKLITNTRSKALSWLGFSADVFLGKFDDQKYVQTLTSLFDNQDAFVNTIATAIRTAKDMGALNKCKERFEEIVGDGTLEDVAVAQELKELIVERKRELTQSGIQ